MVPSEISSIYTQFCIWFSRMESIVTSNFALSDIEKGKPEKIN
jgi:hypothetical protein